MKTRFGIEKGTPFKEIFRVTSVMLGNWGGGSGAECGLAMALALALNVS
jgi:hypothetical protein